MNRSDSLCRLCSQFRSGMSCCQPGHQVGCGAFKGRCRDDLNSFSRVSEHAGMMNPHNCSILLCSLVVFINHLFEPRRFSRATSSEQRNRQQLLLKHLHVNVMGPILGTCFHYWSGIEMEWPNAVDNQTRSFGERVEFRLIKLKSDNFCVS